jgi:hypothetical protein
MSEVHQAAEHHLKFHRRQFFIYLLGCSAMAIGTIVAVLTPGENPGIAVGPTMGFFALMVVLWVAERVRHRAEFKREFKRIVTDEWTQRGMHRSTRIAMMTMVFAQPPLSVFMAYVPEEPSVVGMSMMTIALGCGTWAATYLYYTRPITDE